MHNGTLSLFLIATHQVTPFRTEPKSCFGARCSRGAMEVGRTLQPQTALRLVWGYWDTASRG